MRRLKSVLNWVFTLREYLCCWWAVTPTWRASLVVAGVLALLGLIGAYGYGLFRKEVLERNGRQAVEAAAADDWERARALSLSVVLTGDRRIEILRVLVDSMRRLEDRRLAGFTAALISHPEGTSADRLRMFQWIALGEPEGRVWMSWQQLPASDRAALPFKLALVDRFIQDGDHAQVLDFLKEYHGSIPPPEVAARVIRAQIGQGTQNSLELAQTGLADQVTRHPDGPAEWMDLLESLPIESLDGFILEPLRPWLRAGRPDQPGRGELMEARIQLREAAEAGRGKVVADAVSAWCAEAPHALCRFLVAVGRPETVAETFTNEKVSGDSELIKARLDTLIQLGRDRKLQTSLVRHEGTLRPSELFAYQAVAADRAGNDAERNRCWNRVLAEAVTSPKTDELLRLHAFARQHGLVEEAQRTLLEALKAGRGPLPAYSALAALLKSLEKKGMEHDIMTILATYLRFEPWNSQLIARHSYLSAMLGLEPPAEGIKRVSKLLEGSAGEAHVIAVLATLQLLAGDIGEAGETWNKLSFPPEDLAPGFRTAYLMTRVVAGNLDREDPSVKGIPWETLLPCERNNLNKILLNYRQLPEVSNP